MKTYRLALLVVIASMLAATAPFLMAQQRGAPRPRVSPHETISARIGPGRTLITITYGRPYTKDPQSGQPRKVFGTVVKYTEPWRMGADEATTLITPATMVIGDATIPPGAYTLYAMPSADGSTWKMAFSKKIGFWGIPVDTTQDLVRVDMKKDTVEPAMDQFTMTMDPDASTGGGTIKATWENTQLSVPFTLKP